MTRLQRLSIWTLGVTVVLVAIGGFTRGSGSGYGCEDRWPLCEGGALGGLLPRWDFHMIVEWTHRWVASIALVLIAILVYNAWRRYRGARSLTVATSTALVLTVIQALLGAAVVMTGLHADLVSTHLGTAMVILALLTFVAVESFFVGDRQPITSEAPDRAWRRLLAGGAIAAYVTIMLGSAVHDQYVGGWPLVGGELIPAFTSTLVAIHFLHRVAVAVTFVLLVYLAVGAIRRARPRAEVMLVHAATLLFAVNIGVGAAHVFTQVQSTGLVVVHLLVATLAWIGLVGAFSLARRADRAPLEAPGTRPSPQRDTAEAPA
jgi:heme a synthase